MSLCAPAADWMKFQNTGPIAEAYLSLWKTIYAEVLPASGYDRNESMPTVELYGEDHVRQGLSHGNMDSDYSAVMLYRHIYNS